MDIFLSTKLKYILSIISLACLTSCGGGSEENTAQTQEQEPTSSYKTNILVANKAEYNPQILEPRLKNAWGIAIRPAGLGGHFWVLGGNTSFEYVGDVKQNLEPKLQTLHTDALPYMSMNLDEGADGTGTVFNGGSSFVITQSLAGKADITAPAKFLFAATNGSIHAWTERKNILPDNSVNMDWPTQAIQVIKEPNAQFFGLAINKNYSRIYVADFGVNPQIRTYDGNFQAVNLKFDTPFDTNNNGKVDIGEYAPFNIQYLTDNNNVGHLLVAYAQTSACTEKSIADNICKRNEIEPGQEAGEYEEGEVEEDEALGSGKIAEFDENGKLISVWDASGLVSPWGMAYAPKNFGQYSNYLLVANFGSGLISAYEPTTHKFAGYLTDNTKNYIKLPGIWGLQFGNGASLGDSNTLYFSSGPKDETDGIFGSIRLN